MSNTFQGGVVHLMIPNVPDLPPCTVERPGLSISMQPAATEMGQVTRQLSPGQMTGIGLATSPYSSQRNSQGGLLGLQGRKVPCPLARASRLLFSLLFWKNWNALRTQEVLQPFCHHEGWCQGGSSPERGRGERRKGLVVVVFFFFLKSLFIIFRERGKEGEREGEKHGLPLSQPQMGTWPTTQACALTGNQTGNLLVHRLVLNPLSHSSQGRTWFLMVLWDH